MRHAQDQLEFLHANLVNTASLSNSKLAAAQNSFEAIEQDFRNGLRKRANKTARLRWAMTDKKKTAGLIAQYKETEISASYAIQLEQYAFLLGTRLVGKCRACIRPKPLLIHFKKRRTRDAFYSNKATKAAGSRSRVKLFAS
jgi:hypothetical protein